MLSELDFLLICKVEVWFIRQYIVSIRAAYSSLLPTSPEALRKTAAACVTRW